MELFNQGSRQDLKDRIATEAYAFLETILERAGTFPGVPEQTYLLGTTLLPMFMAGHHLVEQQLGQEKADAWVGDCLSKLAGMMSKGASRTVEISLTSTPNR
jgi:hypothetical protein